MVDLRRKAGKRWVYGAGKWLFRWVGVKGRELPSGLWSGTVFLPVRAGSTPSAVAMGQENVSTANFAVGGRFVGEHGFEVVIEAVYDDMVTARCVDRHILFHVPPALFTALFNVKE